MLLLLGANLHYQEVLYWPGRKWMKGLGGCSLRLPSPLCMTFKFASDRAAVMV